MSALNDLARQVVALFVDDGWLALAIIAVVALSALLAAFAPNPSLLAGAALLLGCPGALLLNVLASARRKRAA